MKGRFHTEEAVIPILQRKGIVVKENDYHEHNNLVVVKEIGIPLNVTPGIRLLGKLDFMRKQGWKVLSIAQMSMPVKSQNKKRRRDEDSNEEKPKKKFFKRNLKK